MSVFRAAVDYAKLAQLMRLPEQQFVTFAQTVGHPRVGWLSSLRPNLRGIGLVRTFPLAWTGMRR